MAHDLSTIKAILLDIKKTFVGHLLNIFKTYAKNPALLLTNWEKYKAILQDKLPDSLTDQEKALIRFACKANRDWHAADSAERQQLLDLGISESEMLRALGAMELFIAFNRFADVMAVEIDF